MRFFKNLTSLQPILRAVVATMRAFLVVAPFPPHYTNQKERSNSALAA
jgi:hypothetical protein